MSRLLDRLRVQFSNGLAASVTESEDSLTLGFRSSCGREMPIYIRPIIGDRVLLSDGGETWNDLVGEGLTDATPLRRDIARLLAVAAMFGVDWSMKERSFIAQCDEKDALDVARRLTMASIAVDGWRVWVPPPERALARQGAIVRQTVSAARKAGFLPEKNVRLPSLLKIDNVCPLLLRVQSKQAAVQFDDASADHVARHAIISVKDSGVHSIIVTSARTARKLHDSLELRLAGIGVVPRLPRGTAKQIVDMAQKLAA